MNETEIKEVEKLKMELWNVKREELKGIFLNGLFACFGFTVILIVCFWAGPLYSKVFYFLEPVIFMLLVLAFFITKAALQKLREWDRRKPSPLKAKNVPSENSWVQEPGIWEMATVQEVKK